MTDTIIFEEKEIWRDVPGYEDVLQVSNTEKFRTKDRYVNHCLGVRIVRGQERKLQKNSTGYLYIIIGKYGNIIFLHRAVAQAFPEICGEWFPGAEVDHKDGNPLNNRPENLRVCTHQENMSFPLARKHISEGRAKIKDSETYKQNKSQGEKNKWTDEYRKRMSEIAKERLKRPEVREKRINNKKLSKPVLQFTLDGTLIAEFPSTHQAERETKILSSSIRSCATGYQKTAGGYNWQYKDNYVN